MDSDSDWDSDSDYDLPNLFELSEDEESVEQLSYMSISRPKYSIGARIQAVTFLDLGIPHLEITKRTGISKVQIYKIRDKAISRGWDLQISGVVEVFHVEDRARSGRPKTSQDLVDSVLQTVTRNSTTRGWLCTRIAFEVSSLSISQISQRTVWRILREHQYFSYKRTVKPGLKLEDKVARLKQCLEHKHWTLEDWKNIIWTDKTSVQLGSVRRKRRVWRRPDKAYHYHVIVRRQKGFSELIQQSSFSYKKKGLFHIWEDETKEEKEACLKDLATRNSTKYEEDKVNWELESGIRRLRATSTIPGRKPVFKYDENTGAYVLKEGKGGINWYRYQEVILKPLLLPFAKECLKERPGTLVQEDRAPSHSSRYQQEVFDLQEIMRLLWPPNSPDLNMIEPCWFWMKRHTTKYGPIMSRAELKQAWIKCWTEMLQERIQAWIERIVAHVKEVIRLEGGNEYQEGRLKGKAKVRVHQLDLQGLQGATGAITGNLVYVPAAPGAKTPVVS